MKFTNGGMEHTPAQTMVFQSDAYNKFNMIKGNRNLDMGKIKKILADIERGTNLLPFVPILVVENNGKLDIIDGQHRFMVAKKIKHLVHYVVCTTLSLYDIARMNSNTEKWKGMDFINCYVQLGNENYVILNDLLKEYSGLPITTAVGLLAGGKVVGGGNYVDAFQKGELKIKYLKETRQLLNTALEFEVGFNLSRAFLQALHKVTQANAFPVKELIKKVNADPSQLQPVNHYKDYLINLEKIAGKGKHGRVAIY
jgi:hypothetical protein